MPYQFSSVDVFTFDVHVTTRHLLRPSLLRKEFRFLADAAAYRKRQKSPAPLKTSSFSVRAIPWRERKWNHFWAAYRSIWHNRSVDDWNLQLPFECRPLDIKPEFRFKPERLQVSMRRPITYLSSVGWSNNLEFHLAGEMTADDLIEFVALLSGGAQLHWGADLIDVYGAFQRLTTSLQIDLYKDPSQIPSDRTLKRYIVVSLVRGSGPPLPYLVAWDPADRHMDGETRAQWHGILNGKKVGQGELAEIEKDDGKSFLLTTFGKVGFTITYFDRATLVFLYDRVLGQQSFQANMRCFGRNIRTCTMMSLLLLHFHSRAAQLASKHIPIRNLRKSVEHTLHDLPRQYKNAYCHTLFHKHAQLRSFCD